MSDQERREGTNTPGAGDKPLFCEVIFWLTAIPCIAILVLCEIICDEEFI